MLKITVEIVPFGIEDDPNRREIATLTIGNLGRVDGELCAYRSRTDDDKVMRPEVHVEHRRCDGALELVRKCLHAHMTADPDAIDAVFEIHAAEADAVFEGFDDNLDAPACAACGNTEGLTYQEYPYGDRCHYDGTSEYHCPCGARTGRWSGKVLKDGEAEPPSGG